MSIDRDRFKKPNSRPSQKKEETPEIDSIWDEIEKIKKEDDKLEHDYKKAKKQLNTLKAEKAKRELNSFFGSVVSFIEEKVIPRLIVAKNYALNNPKKVLPGIAGVVLVFVLISFIGGDNSDTLGVSSTNGEVSNLELVNPSNLEFNILFPAGKSELDYEIVDISPPDGGPAYAYVEQVSEGANNTQITQQKRPDVFDLVEAATNFNALDIIEVDDYKVYHGYAAEAGVQSLIFVKDDLLVSIRSPYYPDEVWVNFIGQLQ